MFQKLPNGPNRRFESKNHLIVSHFRVEKEKQAGAFPTGDASSRIAFNQDLFRITISLMIVALAAPLNRQASKGVFRDFEANFSFRTTVS